jgi:hypothetical protein
LLHFTVIPVYCPVLFFHQCWFYSVLHTLNVSVLIWACYSWQLNQAKRGSKFLICREYLTTVDAVYFGIFWICKWCCLLSVLAMNMSNFRNTQLTEIWVSNCDSSSPYSKILYKVWHLPQFVFLVLSSTLWQHFLNRY